MEQIVERSGKSHLGFARGCSPGGHLDPVPFQPRRNAQLEGNGAITSVPDVKRLNLDLALVPRPRRLILKYRPQVSSARVERGTPVRLHFDDSVGKGKTADSQV